LFYLSLLYLLLST